jgi:hypothetical protein
VARVLIYDNKAHRSSGLTADSMLEVKAVPAPLPILWILGGAFGLVVVALLLVIVLRSGSKGGKRRGGAAAAPSAPIVAGRPQTSSPVIAGGTAPAYATRAVLSGPTGTYTVHQGAEVRAGRDAAQCAIVLNDGRVSSVHTSLKVEQGQLLVRDDGSNNGTFVDGMQLAAGTWTPLRHGGSLRMGPLDFAVRLEA